MAVTVQSELGSWGFNSSIRVAVAEFDCGAAAKTVVLIPASQNKNGLIIRRLWGIVTEVMAGSSEDQGVVTVSDESNNSIGTLTPSNAAADGVGDNVLGAIADMDDATGTALVTVAAGEFVDAILTQICAGTPAGKILLVLEYIPVPSTD